MAYFLRQEKKKNGIYLQMYESFWDSSKKQPRTKCIESFGYAADLTTDEIPDPIAYYKEYVKKKNDEKAANAAEETRPRISSKPLEKNAGYFLLQSLIEELGVKDVVDILSSQKNFQFSVYDMLCQLIYARVLKPCSKSKSVSDVFPMLYSSSSMSEDQVYDGLNFIGESYKKYIELFNHGYEKFYKRDCRNVFFDCTNYYFEIDVPYDDKQKGPSKERRHDPIIGQALLLDSDLVPMAMQMYPGNESEKPYIRKLIEEMKQRCKTTGKTIQVADKGLNCARNIYAAVKEASDGYIFSKSIHGKGLSKTEKQWLLLENDKNVFTDVKGKDGKLLYRYKSCIDDFDYHFKEELPDGEEKITHFTVKEKRVVTYNPALAEKQKMEIRKMADKAANITTMKKAAKEEIGDSSKYLKVINTDKNGKKVKPVMMVDDEAVQEDLKYAGYNLIVTSETGMNPEQIYKIYHNLWKIEESFRITKSYLDGRPVYVQKKETVYGHFLVCYLSLFLLRTMEIKCFKNEINTYDLIAFMRDFRVVNLGGGNYLNISHNQKVIEKVKKLTGLTNLDALYLTQKEIDGLFKNTMLIES